MAGVRLQAYLLTDDPKPRALATASLDLEDLSVKACALLSLVRPLLSPPARATAEARAVLYGLRAGLEDHVGKGVNLRVGEGSGSVDANAAGPPDGTRNPEDLPEIGVDGELIRCLLMPLLQCGSEAADPGGEVVVEVEASADAREVVFSVEDDGSREESLAGWRDQACRGRPLVCQVADYILARRGGRLEVIVADGRTRIELRVPSSTA